MSDTIGSYTVVERRPGKVERLTLRRDGRDYEGRVIDAPADDDLVAQANREVDIVRALPHPALRPVHEILRQDGRLTLVSELPPPRSVSLGALIAAAPLAPVAAWWVGTQLGGLLGQSHTASDGDDFIAVSHGHLEPARVMVTEAGDVRLSGLGLASLVGQGLVVNPAFTAPEQRSGGRVTPRGDVYAIAVLLWAMLQKTVPLEPPTVEDVVDRTPGPFHEAFGRALEAKVSRRKITAMELEQWLGDLADGGRAALAAAVASSRAEAVLARQEMAAEPSAPSTPRPATTTRPGLGRASAPRRQATTRRGPYDPAASRPRKSRQPTLMGQATPGGFSPPVRRPEAPTKAPAASPSPPADPLPPPRASQSSGMDWSAAAEAAKRPSVPPGFGGADLDDDLDWGDDEETIIAAKPTEEEIAAAEARLEARAESPPQTGMFGAFQTPEADDEDDDESATMIVRSPLDDADEVDRAMAMADSALDALTETMSDEPTATADPPSERMRRGSLLGGGGLRARARERAAASSRPESPSPPRVTSPSRPDLPAPRPFSPSRPDLPPPRPSSPSRPDELPSELRHAMVGPKSEPSSSPESRRPSDPANGADARGDGPDAGPPRGDVTPPLPTYGRLDGGGSPKGKATSEPEAVTEPEDGPTSLADDDLGATIEIDDTPPVLEPPEVAAAAAADDDEDPPSGLAEAGPRATLGSEPVLDVTPLVASEADDAPPPQDPSGPAASPWSQEAVPAERVATVGDRPFPLWAAALVTVVTAGAVMTAGIWWVRRSADVRPPPMPLASAPTSSAAAAASDRAPAGPRGSAILAPPLRPPLGTATAATSASAPVSSAAASASASAASARNPADLPMTSGFLDVAWSGPKDAEIFLFGKKIGRVGELVEIPCTGMQNIRVGTSERRWLSEGQAVQATCRQTTRVTIAPSRP
ncbi:MAG: hypothetical protein AAGN82_21380 [Myxococcota bacterium]